MSHRYRPNKLHKNQLRHTGVNWHSIAWSPLEVPPKCCVLWCVLGRFDLSDSMDCDLPGSPVHGILHTRILQWVAKSSSRGIFETQGSNPHLLCLLHWQVDSLPLAPKTWEAKTPNARDQFSTLLLEQSSPSEWPSASEFIQRARDSPHSASTLLRTKGITRSKCPPTRCPW